MVSPAKHYYYSIPALYPRADVVIFTTLGRNETSVDLSCGQFSAYKQCEGQ